MTEQIHIPKVMVDEVAKRSGLKPGTVVELLNAGYSFVEHINDPHKWVRDSQFKKETHASTIGSGGGRGGGLQS